MNEKKLSNARLNETTDAFVEAFTASVDFDQRLALQDIRASLAHAMMLNKKSLLTDDEHKAISEGLAEISNLIESDEFPWSVAQEDVHMNIEAELIKRIGDTGKKLHTGRSRNDQVATDVRLWLRDQIDLIAKELKRTQSVIVQQADQHRDTIMPGFTHLQIAQPVTFGHHLLAWYEMLKRDHDRLFDCRKRLNQSPLGAAALAGTSFPIDRELTAQVLDFDMPCANSIDAVSDRDFLIEFLSFASIVMMHLSRFSEELIIWSSTQFNFVELPESFCTGSSIMPQKKNPDVPELIRGKSARVFGHLFALLTLMKSQPLAYNRDNQEDKEPLFDAVDTVHGALAIFADLISQLKPDKERMYSSALEGYATATDLADYLVGKGLAFRDAHEIVGKAVRLAISQNCRLSELKLEQLKELSHLIDHDVFELLELEHSVAARNHSGGTAPEQVAKAVAKAMRDLNA